MCPEKARVFIAEDDLDIRKLMEGVLEQGGHSIVSTATSLEDALKAVKDFGKKEVQVAILDGNLTPGDVSGKDGQHVLTAIRRYAPKVKTIGFSSSVLPMPGVDQNLRKINLADLSKTVTKI